jgi:hypothetical protein
MDVGSNLQWSTVSTIMFDGTVDGLLVLVTKAMLNS